MAELDRLKRGPQAANRLARALGQSEEVIEQIERGEPHTAMAAFGLCRDQPDLENLTEEIYANCEKATRSHKMKRFVRHALGIGLLLLALVACIRSPANPGPVSRGATSARASVVTSSTPTTVPLPKATVSATERAQPATVPSATPPSHLDLEELETWLENKADANLFSGAVLIAKDGVPIFERAYGMANKSFRAPNRSDTKFNIASMGKMFTAVAIAQLAEQGRLTFDDPIGRHLPDYPNQEAAGTVTIHHLLTHTSGLGDYLDKQAFQQGPKDRFRSVASYFRLFAHDPLLFQPGERFQYSNAGYIVLGRIVEKVSGDNYFDYLHQHIYGPAGMTNSDSYEINQDIPNLAIGYLGITPAEEGARTNELALPFKGSPAGGSYSTVGDLLKFATALQTHRLLSPQSTELLLTGKIDSGFDTQYGYGFIVERVDRVRIVGHSGGFPGINARLDMYLDLGYTVVVLSNQDPAPVDTPVEKIRAMITGK